MRKKSKVEIDLLAEAQILSAKGDTLQAANVMKKLIGVARTVGIYHASLANLYWDAGNIVGAEKAFYKATQLSPQKEKISLGLFHFLWEQEKIDEAFEEMKRFMKISDSREYRKVVKDITESL